MQNYNPSKSRVHLIVKPSFLTGVARLVDFSRSLNTYNTATSGFKADYDALYSDWLAVGDDLESAINEYAERVETP